MNGWQIAGMALVAWLSVALATTAVWHLLATHWRPEGDL